MHSYTLERCKYIYINFKSVNDHTSLKNIYAYSKVESERVDSEVVNTSVQYRQVNKSPDRLTLLGPKLRCEHAAVGGSIPLGRWYQDNANNLSLERGIVGSFGVNGAIYFGCNSDPQYAHRVSHLSRRKY